MMIMLMIIMMMNCFCIVIDQGKASSLISRRDITSDMLQAGFKPTQNLSAVFVE